MPPRKQPGVSKDKGDPPAKIESVPTEEQASAGASQSEPSDAAAAQSTEATPAARPTRPLESIKRTGSASARGSPGAGRAKPAVAPKFAGRRSQTARQELEQAEAKKKAAEKAAAEAENKKKAQEARKFGYGRGGGDRGGRGVGRGGRGRGGHMGDDRRRGGGGAVPSGPFGAGQASSEARRSGWSSSGGPSGPFGGGQAVGGGGSSRWGSGGGGGGSGGGGRSYGGSGSSGLKTEPGTGGSSSGGMPYIKPEDGGYVSSDEEEAETGGPKQNIDQLQVIDLTGEDDEKFAPVRLWREEHKDRTVGLSVEEELANEDDAGTQNASSEKKKGKQRVKDLEVTGANEKSKRPTAYSSSDTEGEIYIKEEPVDDDSTRPTTPEPRSAPADDMITSPVSSPESRRKAKEKIKSATDAILADEDDDIHPPEPPKFQTQAEKDEWERHYDDLRDLRNELGSLMSKTATDGDGDATMADTTPATERIKERQKTREEHVYLFQFPPVLPHLSEVKVKADPDNINVRHPHDPQPMDVDGEEEAKDGKKNEGQPADQPKFPAGAVGKLRVHKSGKTTLDWGGTSLVLGMGAEATFLQNIMIAKMPDKKPLDDSPTEAGDTEHALGMGMGQIRSKFVVTPDWDEILK